MPNMSNTNALQFVRQGMMNLALHRPLAISLEVTHSCNCNCNHCDKGGMIPGEVLAPAEKFAELVCELKPLIAQISGGEPLLRDDIFDIVRAIKNWGKLPYMVFVTNAWLLTEEKYLKLKELGIDEFSISLDFPDSRHDDNRGIPGLYDHLNDLVPRLARHGNHDITLISVIRSETVGELPKLAQHAVDWDVAINFSAYTPLRTNDQSRSIHDPRLLQELRNQLDYIIRFKRETGRVFTAESTLEGYYKFFGNGSYMPNCRAGCRSLVINPDGRLAPCAMQPVSFHTRKELIEQFSRTNLCGGCYVSLRANTEKSLKALTADALKSFLQMSRNGGKSC